MSNDKVLNLNKFRKAKQKREEKRKADENAIRHGRNKQERQEQQKKADKAQREHEGHKLSPDEPPKT